MPDLASTGIQTAVAGAQIVSGIVNAAKTKKIAKELEANRPKYSISQLAKNDLSLAESELASGGLSSRAETAYNNLNNQQFSSSLSAILRGGGSVNNVADVYSENEAGRSRLALISDQMRMAKIQNLMKTREMFRDEEDKEFQINEYAPWRDKTVANNEARQKAQNQIWGGLGTAGSAGMSFFGQQYQEGQYDKYFNQGQPTRERKSGFDTVSNFNFNPQPQTTPYTNTEYPFDF